MLVVAVLWPHRSIPGSWIAGCCSSIRRLVVFSAAVGPGSSGFWWRTTFYGEMVGVLGAFPVGYTVWFGSDAILPDTLRGLGSPGSDGANLNGLVPAFGDLQRFPFWAGFAIIFGMGWIAILLATLLTRPESMDVLRKFYRDVRPIGFWGPVEAELPEGEPEIHQETSPFRTRACGLGVGILFPDGAGTVRSHGPHFLLAAVSSVLAAAMGTTIHSRVGMAA